MASSLNSSLKTDIVVPLWMNGEECFGAATFDVFSPSLEDTCWKATSATPLQASSAVESSEKAFQSWCKTKPTHRSEILFRAASILETNAAEYAEYMATEMGAEIAVAQFFVIWEEESFGPIVTLITVASDQEAVTLANSSQYGFSASVFTSDLRKGLAIAKELQSGAVHINSMTVHDEPTLPFGGVKSSGWGRFNADQGMEEFLVTKSITWDD